ncbi:MAG: hypothetical protein ABJG47_09090 [Ekhidna sp.]
MKKLFWSDDQSFEIRYVESAGEWEVLDNSGVVYMGTKQNCRTFIETCKWLKNMSKNTNE